MLSPIAQKIYAATLAAMQDAEEISGDMPAADYARLMVAIRDEAARRLDAANTATRGIKAGDTVKFIAPNPDETEDRFTVLELRGDRVQVESNDSFWNGRAFRPNFVYLLSDMELSK